jgi:hypothetical protein
MTVKSGRVDIHYDGGKDFVNNDEGLSWTTLCASAHDSSKDFPRIQHNVQGCVDRDEGKQSRSLRKKNNDQTASTQLTSIHSCTTDSKHWLGALPVQQALYEVSTARREHPTRKGRHFQAACVRACVRKKSHGPALNAATSIWKWWQGRKEGRKEERKGCCCIPPKRGSGSRSESACAQFS